MCRVGGERPDALSDCPRDEVSPLDAVVLRCIAGDLVVQDRVQVAYIGFREIVGASKGTGEFDFDYGCGACASLGDQGVRSGFALDTPSVRGRADQSDRLGLGSLVEAREVPEPAYLA